MARYLEKSGADLNRALTLYEVNTEVSETFYTSLHCLEVCFRNKLNAAMVNRYSADWFHNSAVPLTEQSRNFISEAIRELQQPAGAEILPGQIVAQLRFAFWVGLLGPSYDATLWRHCFHRIFKRSNRKRSEVQARLNAVRRLRNRIAHHEPILWRDTPLDQTHEEILETIGWMCSSTAAWARHRSTLLNVLPANL